MENVSQKPGLFCVVFILLVSCSKFDHETTSLYSIDSLLTRQSRYLSGNASRLTKVSSLGERSDTVMITPKSIEEWKKELEIFGVIEGINKPANKSFYHIDILPDRKSNLNVKTFTTKEALPVQYLRLFYQATEDNIRKLEARYIESNALYNSTRLLTMEFQQIDDNIVLTSYEIWGDQKMFLGDSVKYLIKGHVTLSN